MKRIIAFILSAMLIMLPAVSTCETALDYQYAQVSTQSGPLNMRKTASSKADIIEKIPNGTTLTILSKDDTWCACLYNDQEGFVMTKFLSFMDISQFQTLSLNDSGQDVLAVKEKLQELYYYDADAKLDDRYDLDTETVIKQFQSAQGMEETGIASPELQAFIFGGPAKNNLPTKKITVTISSSCSGYNHVGDHWSKYYSINSVKVSSGDIFDIVLGESISVYTKITESDSSPDVGSAKDDVDISQEFFDSGYTITQKVVVKENKGRYAGNRANWTVTYTFTP